MKHLTIAALLAVSLFAAAPAARAADWTNGDISCEVTNIELVPWRDVFNWGKWENFTMKFYKN